MDVYSSQVPQQGTDVKEDTEEDIKEDTEEIVVEEKSSKAAKYILVACVIFTALALLCISGYLFYKVYFLNL